MLATQTINGIIATLPRTQSAYRVWSWYKSYYDLDRYQQIDYEFQVVDQDHDGLLTKDELGAYIRSKLGEDYSHETVEQIFDDININRDNSISKYVTLFLTLGTNSRMATSTWRSNSRTRLKLLSKASLMMRIRSKCWRANWRSCRPLISSRMSASSLLPSFQVRSRWIRVSPTPRKLKPKSSSRWARTSPLTPRSRGTPNPVSVMSTRYSMSPYISTSEEVSINKWSSTISRPSKSTNRSRHQSSSTRVPKCWSTTSRTTKRYN